MFTPLKSLAFAVVLVFGGLWFFVHTATPILAVPPAALGAPIWKCVGFTGPLQYCNYSICTCTPASNLTVQDDIGCEQGCFVTGSLSCGGAIAPAPSVIDCGQRGYALLVCPGGPGFGCDWNLGQLLICDGDYAMADELGLTLERTTTCMAGDGHCNFCYHVKAKVDA